jgi:hypothetical protein
MGWEDRGGCGPYYYRSVRRGDHVQKVYRGGGVLGQIAALRDELGGLQREEEAAHWRKERLRVEEDMAFLNELEEAAKVLTTASLIVSGYHCCKGTWRKRREQSS